MHRKSICKKLGENILRLRKTNKLSQYQLAESARINRAYLSLIEIGQGNPTVWYVWKISRALRVSIVELFDGI